MSSENAFNFLGYSIPVRLAHLTGGGEDTFAAISQGHIQLLQEYIGLRADMHVVEIGCGIGRDAIPLTTILSDRGSYTGIDVVKDMIEWDQSNITPRHPNFQFHHFDVREPWYNPNGEKLLEEYKLPCADSSIDLIILQSVFTHMLRDDILHYLREFRRVLKPEGRVYATFFILDADFMAHQGPHSYVQFIHPITADCWVANPEKPTQTVGYFYAAIEEMMRQARLQEARAPLLGSWSGRRPQPIGGQDTVIMKRSD
jgi:ubiquinone/menaquinone biosynthesis C-methylase UbiE